MSKKKKILKKIKDKGYFALSDFEMLYEEALIEEKNKLNEVDKKIDEMVSKMKDEGIKLFPASLSLLNIQ